MGYTTLRPVDMSNSRKQSAYMARVSRTESDGRKSPRNDVFLPNRNCPKHDAPPGAYWTLNTWTNRWVSHAAIDCYDKQIQHRLKSPSSSSLPVSAAGTHMWIIFPIITPNNLYSQKAASVPQDEFGFLSLTVDLSTKLEVGYGYIPREQNQMAYLSFESVSVHLMVCVWDCADPEPSCSGDWLCDWKLGVAVSDAVTCPAEPEVL